MFSPKRIRRPYSALRAHFSGTKILSVSEQTRLAPQPYCVETERCLQVRVCTCQLRLQYSLAVTACLSVLVIIAYAVISFNQARIEIPLLIKELDAASLALAKLHAAAGPHKSATEASRKFGLSLACTVVFIIIHFINFRANASLYVFLVLMNAPLLLTAIRKEIEISGFSAPQRRIFAIVYDCFSKCPFIPRYFVLTVLSILVTLSLVCFPVEFYI